ncbi:GNAT family N-acetyltransferase [Cloacibacterium sp. TD35]|uniref:GNAT family N-acetyltransferase n=1 Tax=Cloacibacterium sp. TD35 TaxID=2976818 RepID=UPI00237D7E71|nr:GNAT family N-acetyltransferase [Cloacibacterium sp. TD35]WDT68568.1 N-acetyltransferase [Cloacibacterium sp. TD35]
MEIQHQDNGKKGVFFIEENGEIIAEMTYVWSGEDKIIIDHTEVSEKLGGKGIGKQLVHKAVEMAREKHIKILPLCPFAKRVFDKIEEYQDVLF